MSFKEFQLSVHTKIIFITSSYKVNFHCNTGNELTLQHDKKILKIIISSQISTWIQHPVCQIQGYNI